VADKHSVEIIRKLLEAAKPRQFKESVELAVNLRDVDLSVPKNRVDEEVVLPKGRGKPIRICVFASGELALKARNVADLVIQPQGSRNTRPTSGKRAPSHNRATSSSPRRR